MEDIAKEVAVLKVKFQNSEVTKDLMKEIAVLQTKMQAKDATNDIRALQTKIEVMEDKLEANEKALQLKTTEIEALQNKVNLFEVLGFFQYKSDLFRFNSSS